jgi:putative acetyltransferase
VLEIRPEAPADHDAARELLRAAFEPGGGEPELVDALRAAGDHVPELCLAALEAGELIGHVFYSRVTLDSGHEALALAPMAVRPDAQRRGVGSRLVEESLVRAAKTDFPLVVVLGHPAYYPRFGFEPADRFGVLAPWEVPPEAWMVHPLPAYHPDARGLVTYPAAFGSVT